MLYEIAQEYFFRMQYYVTETCSSRGATHTEDIKLVKRLIGKKLIAESEKRAYLNPEAARKQDQDDRDQEEYSAEAEDDIETDE